MVIRYIIAIIFFLLASIASSQSENSKLIEHLINEKGIQHIQLSNNENPIFRFLDGEDVIESQEIIPVKDGITVLLSGNSKVYQYNRTKNFLERIDQSRYHGHNFGATNLQYNDTLFSFGGYGFWQMNGGVRYYNKNTSEWDIIKTSKIVTFANGINAISFFSEDQAKLYVLYHHYNSEYLRSRANTSPLELAIFNFKTKNWEENVLLINKEIASDISDLSSIQKIKDGLILNSKKKSLSILLNFSKNLVYTLKPSITTELIQFKNKHQNNLNYTIENTLYIFDRTLDSLFTFKFEPTVFEKTNIPIYISVPQKINLNNKYLIGLLILLIITVNIIVVIKLKNKTRKNIQSIEIDKRDIKDFINSLDEIEKIVVKHILENAKESQNTTTNQLNKLMGTDKKEFKVQNNIRSEMILNINKKFKLFITTNDELIERERAEVDKRFMEYNLNKLFIKKLNLKMF